MTAVATYTDRRGIASTLRAQTENDVEAKAVKNQAPKFYKVGVNTTGTIADNAAENTKRTPQNEASTYVRYVLEGKHPRNVRTTKLAARNYEATTDGTDNNTAAVVNPYDSFQTQDNLDADPVAFSHDAPSLHLSLSGDDAKYFEIPLAADTDATPNKARGLIRTKVALDYEKKRTYTFTVTATDPAGLTDTATVTIHALDVPEIKGLEQRMRVPENTFEITDLSVADPPDISLGGIKWSLLTASGDPVTDPVHNRNHADSVDCQYEDTGVNEKLCDDFRFSNFNTANTTLLFAIGTGAKHDAPDFEKPADMAGERLDTTNAVAADNVYEIRVRAAFANLRSQQGDPIPANHPTPQDDERQDKTVWIRVDDVDEAPAFRNDSYERSVEENTDDALPVIAINRLVGATVPATDPEYGYMAGRQYGKKLNYSPSLPEAYKEMFQIVPGTGQILTKSRVNYEALNLKESGPQGGQYKTITGPEVTATDTADRYGKIVGPVPVIPRDAPKKAAPNSDATNVNVIVNDVNETPLIMEVIVKAGTTEVSQFSEDREDTAAGKTVGSYEVEGGDELDTATVTWSVEGPDAADFSIGSDGVLTINSVPDFENPTDRDEDPATDGDQGKGDNVYKVTVKATFGSEEATRAVTVTVTDVEEEVDPSNVAPEFADATTTRRIAENTAAGTNIGDPVAATDSNSGDVLVYSLSGTDAVSFSIGLNTGQLQTLAPLNYETKNTYNVVVTATDPDGESDTTAVTINVTDVDEGVPAIPAIVDEYDSDNSGKIEIDELFKAIDDYFDVDIELSIDDLFAVIDAYFREG